MKKVVVVGGSGFAGSHTADSLSEKGYAVTLFDKAPSSWIKDGQSMVLGDITNKKDISNAIEGAYAVYNFAGIADIQESVEKPFETFNLNVMGTVNLLESCVKNKVKRFVYASTMYVYSAHGSFYKASKQASEVIIESYAKEQGLDYTFLRYGSLYGPRSQEWNGLNKIVKTILKNKSITYKGTGKELREYIHVKDASELSVKILNDEYINKAVILTGHQEINSSQLMNMISEISGINFTAEFDEKNIDPNHYAITPYRYSPKTAIKLIPEEFIDLGQGILELIEDSSS